MATLVGPNFFLAGGGGGVYSPNPTTDFLVCGGCRGSSPDRLAPTRRAYQLTAPTRRAW
jgi:hypothetical protein